MLSKEEIENNRIPKEIAKVLEIDKEDNDSLIAFKESLFEQTTKENIKLKKQIEQLESREQKLIEKLEKDIAEYPEAKYTKWYLCDLLKILKGENKMNKIENRIVNKKQTIHKFYCDSCNKLILESEEYDDGYYATPSIMKIKIFMFKRWYSLNKLFCEECLPKFEKDITNKIKELGFKEEK